MAARQGVDQLVNTLLQSVSMAKHKNDTKTASQVLRELREARGTSLRTAAKELGVDPAHLSRVERGEKSPSGDLGRRAARYYEVPEEELQLASGTVPEDVVEILNAHPELISDLRKRYGNSR